MNQPTTIDFDKADGMTSTQVCIRTSERKDYYVSLLFFSGHCFDSSTAGKWGVDSIEICQVPKCPKSSTIHKVRYTWRRPLQLKFQGQPSRGGSDCSGSIAYHRYTHPCTFFYSILLPLGPCLDLAYASHFVPGEPHTERHVGAQGRFLSVPEEFTLS